ncbi:hypothetical protein DFH07DRAFT_784917 [Mycena maculata]|uniref:Uncharacterized protein n=1 Tax=Mycena maculata TaxID=230809 RepID=A0AAD7HEA5_9AGAR|nr:hypothetical protein DFH07DRAFT_784917 [Mycena maculata]
MRDTPRAQCRPTPAFTGLAPGEKRMRFLCPPRECRDPMWPDFVHPFLNLPLYIIYGIAKDTPSSSFWVILQLAHQRSSSYLSYLFVKIMKDNLQMQFFASYRLLLSPSMATLALATLEAVLRRAEEAADTALASAAACDNTIQELRLSVEALRQEVVASVQREQENKRMISALEDALAGEKARTRAAAAALRGESEGVAQDLFQQRPRHGSGPSFHIPRVLTSPTPESRVAADTSSRRRLRPRPSPTAPVDTSSESRPRLRAKPFPMASRSVSPEDADTSPPARPAKRVRRVSSSIVLKAERPPSLGDIRSQLARIDAPLHHLDEGDLADALELTKVSAALFHYAQRSQK